MTAYHDVPYQSTFKEAHLCVEIKVDGACLGSITTQITFQFVLDLIKLDRSLHAINYAMESNYII